MISRSGTLPVLVFCALLAWRPPACSGDQATVTFKVTNGGQDAGSQGSFYLHKPTDHDHAVCWAHSGNSCAVEAGDYDIRIAFEHGEAKKEIWLNGQKLEGKVERSVDVGVAVAEVTFKVTNGGHDTGSQGSFYLHKPTDHDHAVCWAHSTNECAVEAGDYDIRIAFEHGEAKKEIWLNGQKLEGKVERSAEVGVAVAEVTFKVTNGGEDTGSSGRFYLHKPSDHDHAACWAHSGTECAVEAGDYDVEITFEQGQAKKEIWLDGQKLEGKVERSVEVGVAVAEVTFKATNGGRDTGSSGSFYLHKPTDHEHAACWAHSGNSCAVAAGEYDVRVYFEDDEAKKEIWLAGQKLEGKVERTVEIGLPIAEVTIKITHQGADLGDKAWWGLYDPGERDRNNRLAWNHSSHSRRLPEGTYDIGVFYHEANADVVKWAPGLEARGKVERTVEIGVALADLKVRVTRKGEPLKDAWCGAFPDGEAGSSSVTAKSDEWMRTAEGMYDVGCFYEESGLSTSKWLKRQELKGKVELAMDLEWWPASLTVTAASGTTKGEAASRHPNIELVLDASGSMWARVEEKNAARQKTRIEIARGVLSGVIQKLPDSGVNVALRVYGTEPKGKQNCTDSKLFVPLGPIEKTGLLKAIAAVTPNGYTPIAYNLEKAAADLPKGENNSLVLVTDGIESCGGDPCAVASRLASQGILARTFVVGFTVARDKTPLLDCIGTYYPASNQAELERALGEIFEKALAPATGTVAVWAGDKLVASGNLGEKLAFPAGTYDVRIRAGAKDITWKAVPLKGEVTRPLP